MRVHINDSGRNPSSLRVDDLQIQYFTAPIQEVPKVPYGLDDSTIKKNVRGPQDLRAVLVTRPDPGVAHEDGARALLEAIRLLAFKEIGRWAW